MAEPLIARIARSAGGKLLNKAAERLFPAATEPDAKSKPKRSITGAIAGAAITRIATRSVPGAILIGGGILAKGLYDRRRAHLARRKQAKVEEAGDAQA